MLPLPVFAYQAIVQGKKMVGHHTANDLLIYDAAHSLELWIICLDAVVDFWCLVSR